jgi:hypothetical protein
MEFDLSFILNMNCYRVPITFGLAPKYSINQNLFSNYRGESCGEKRIYDLALMDAYYALREGRHKVEKEGVITNGKTCARVEE